MSGGGSSSLRSCSASGVEEAEVPATVFLDGGEAEVELFGGLLDGATDLGDVGGIEVVGDQFADREGLAVDRRRGFGAHVDVDDVGDVGGADGDRLELELDVDALDVGEVGLGRQHLEPRELADEIDHRIPEHVALAGREHVDHAEHVLVLDRRQQLGAELVRRGRAALGGAVEL